MNLNSLFRKLPIQKESTSVLIPTLNKWDLTGLGIAAIIGAGIFSTIGKAASEGGPAVTLLFLFTAIACFFSALCYAEFASAVPNAGSAYTYAYVSIGEFIAWIIGWDLILEYAIGNVAVAISWSDYFTSFLEGFNIHLPWYLCMDYYSAAQIQNPYYASLHEVPNWFGFPIVLDLPAGIITILITYVTYIGIKKTKQLNNALVLFKVIILIGILCIGALYVKPLHWSPFAPNGLEGILNGVSAVFFAYIGFDAISTTSEECINPQKDLPLGMFYALIISTILYILITLVLTGMVPYHQLNVGDPLAHVFEHVDLNFISGIVSLSAIIALASVLLVFQLGQPRIWLAMSRDGLLPSIFAKIHPIYKTPSVSTIVTGLIVGIPAMTMNLTIVTDLCSIGTLFAFALVCVGVLLKPQYPQEPKFKIPYLNSAYYAPLLYIALLFTYIYYFEIVNTTQFMQAKYSLHFLFFFLLIAWSSYKKWSLIPLLGLMTNLFLLTELGWNNWIRFGIWLLIGIIIYMAYGFRHSRIKS